VSVELAAVFALVLALAGVVGALLDRKLRR
jgi:hypothetical protein